jgi:outer membrane protein TolC
MSRSRWIKRALAGVLAVAGSGGCKQQLFMEPGDYHDAVKVGLPKSLETNPHGPIVPGTVERLQDPNTVIDFVRPPRHMTLRECIAIALEQGNVGSQAPNNPGFKNEQLEQFSGRNVGGSDAIRTFAIDPAIAAAEVERSLSKFDARWITTMQWQKVDQPTAAQFLSFQNARDAAAFSSTLAKPLPTGGVAGITFSTDYSKFSQTAQQQLGNFVNPNYTPRLQFTFEQPLWRLFGVEINQLAPSHAGSLLLQGLQPTGGVGTEGILISRLRLDQNKANFDLQVNYMLVNVEAAYWNLYAAYYNLYAQEEGLRQAFEGYRFIAIRVKLGTDPPQRLNQIQAQFHRFQRQVLQARGQVLESERQLRGLLGLRSDDGTRIVPIDEPNVAQYKPDFHEAATDAVANRPELMLARQDLKFRQLDLMLQKNLRRPDLRGFAQYDIAGLGTRLDGRTEDFDPATGVFTPGNAFGSFIDNRFNSWTLGLRMDMPLGFRDANALVRQAQLNMTKSYVQLRDTELKAIEYLALQYRRVIQTHREIAPVRGEREQLQEYLVRIREVIRIGNWDPRFFLDYLTVQQQLAGAIAAESQAVANYNIALAQFEFAKGTIQQYNSVTVGEGPLPPWVSKRAADHIRERTEAALKLREQPPPPAGPAVGGHPVGPAGGTASVLHLPPFAEPREPLPDKLPDPRPVEPPMKKPENPPVGPGVGRLTPGNLTGSGGNPSQPLAPPRPLPTHGTTPGAADGYFQPDGRVTIPPHPRAGGGLTPVPPPAGTGAGRPGVESPETPKWTPPDTRDTALPPIPTPPPPPALPAVPSIPGGQ